MFGDFCDFLILKIDKNHRIPVALGTDFHNFPVHMKKISLLN